MTAMTEFEALASICAGVGEAIDEDRHARERVSRVLRLCDRASATFAPGRSEVKRRAVSEPGLVIEDG